MTAATYRIVKAYHLFDVEAGETIDRLASMLIFHDLWGRLTKPQRAALLADERTAVRPVTLARLREHQLVDDAGRTTLLGEAVLHYRPRPADDS